MKVSSRSALTTAILGTAATVLSVLSAQWLLALAGVATAASGFRWWRSARSAAGTADTTADATADDGGGLSPGTRLPRRGR